MRRLDPSHEEWMRAAETAAVMDALMTSGGQARFVGGAVRNALLDREVVDVDIATPLAPEDVVRRLEQATITAIPTGIAHGTVTAVLNDRTFEITTLRRDVVTDGRRATVAFSDDWAEDARRRDFTINALYASRDGEIFDFADGIQDLESGRVRFIGNPVTRIREDYLRILRLFRFHTWYGTGDIDREALVAAKDERAGLQRLSGERIQKELLRLLEADNPVPTLRAMAGARILSELIPGELQVGRLEGLVDIDRASFFAADPVLRLAALLPADRARAAAVAERLRVSNDVRDRLVDLAGFHEKLAPDLSVRETRQRLYRLGTRRFRDRVLLAWAEDRYPSHGVAWRALLALADAWISPRFPLTGRDVIAAGIPEGPLVGRVLAQLEAWWIANEFTDDKSALAERLNSAVTSAGSV
jgi:poly(A) polymerase